MGQRAGTRTSLSPGPAESVTDTIRAEAETGDDPGRPLGREAVVQALIDSTISLVIERGTDISVRQIAASAGVNHGLVHTYFGSKQALLVAAIDEVHRRAAADVDDAGFPPADLATRRGGELAKAIARVRLDAVPGLLEAHPVADSWHRALASTRPDLDDGDIESMVATASALALGWAVFADHICEASGLDTDRRRDLDARIAEQVAEIGGLPR